MSRIFLSFAGPNVPVQVLNEIVHALRVNGHEPIRQEWTGAEPAQMDTVSTLVGMCRAAIGIVVDDNPTVFFELGVAVGQGKKVLMVGRRGQAIPHDLALFAQIAFDGSYAGVHNDVVGQVLDWVRLNVGPTDRDDSPNLRALLASYQENPTIVDRIPREQLEEMIADWFRQRGADVSVEPGGYDGYDLEVRHGEERILVEIRKVSPGSKVSVREVQQLLGAVTAGRAHRGILISTSGFTASARDFSERTRIPIALWTLGDLATK